MEDLDKTKINIRLMQKEDIPEVERIEQLSFPSPWSSQLFSLELKKKDFAYYWVLHPSSRRKGLGKTLLTHILEDARKRKIKKVTLEVRRSNRPAQNLYEQFGFKKIAIRPHYYHDTGEDAIVYWKTF